MNFNLNMNLKKDVSTQNSHETQDLREGEVRSCVSCVLGELLNYVGAYMDTAPVKEDGVNILAKNSVNAAISVCT